MMGATHGVSGAVTGLGLVAAAIVPPPPVHLVPAIVALGYVAAYLSDLDHPNATATRVLGPVGWALCAAIRNLSVLCGMPAHRGLSHWAPYAVAWGVLVGAGTYVLGGDVRTASWLGAAVLAGCLAGMFGDLPTRQSLKYVLYVPRCLRFTTGGRTERGVQYVLVALGAVLLVPVLALYA